MSNLYQLSDYELSQLHSIDPVLSHDWQEVLRAILPKLDKDNQLIVLEEILKPKGLLYSQTNKIFYTKASQKLLEVCKSFSISNKQLLKAVEQMTAFIDSPPPVSAMMPKCWLTKLKRF